MAMTDFNDAKRKKKIPGRAENGVHNGIGKQPTNEEQMARRQSAPTPTVQDEAQKMLMMKQQQEMLKGQGIAPSGAVNGIKAITLPIGKEQVNKATTILNKYKEGKVNLDKRIVENEQWYRGRHWECMRDKKDDIQPTSAWLFNCIANKHADVMDNFPAPNILPREEGDKPEAEMLTSILPVVLDQNNFEQTYDEVSQQKIKSGTGAYGVFWDSSKLNGLGDISIRKVDILNLFWESGIADIQKSQNIFHIELADNELLVKQYPQLHGTVGGKIIQTKEYVYDDNVDTTEKSVVVDWYYKKFNGSKTVLHYCKYVNDTVLFATENDERYAQTGWYDHGEYPFIFDVLYPVEGTPIGFGYIDIGKDVQGYIDRGNQAIMKNMLANAKPRHFISSGGAVNEKEYADLDNDFIHVDGGLGQDSILPVQGKPLNDIYVKVIQDKVDELKETTGNRDISTGGTTSGVTAASAIAAMQEAGSKLSRDNNKASYRAFRKLSIMCIELIRQFYNLPRYFRILGENGAAKYVKYTNAGIRPQPQGVDLGGNDMGYRLPLFDIEVTAQKASPYSKMAQNEMALQFFNAGFFNPQIADQALACLDMMDFDRKQFIMQKIAQNGTMYQQIIAMQQQMLQLGAMVDRYKGGNEITAGLMNQFGMQGAMPTSFSGMPNPSETEALGGKKPEAENTKKARQRVAESTAPN